MTSNCPICSLSKVDLLRNKNLIIALRNLGLLMEVYFSSLYKGVFSVSIEHLEGSGQPFELVSAGYLKYSIELVLRNFFRSVRSKKSIDPPFVVISRNMCLDSYETLNAHEEHVLHASIFNMVLETNVPCIM